MKHMLLSYLCYYQTRQQLMLLSNTCYYQTPHVSIRHLMLLSNKSWYYLTTHVIVKHLMLLSTSQPNILTLQLILWFTTAALAHRCATGLSILLAGFKAWVQVQVRNKNMLASFGVSKAVILNMIIALWLLTLHRVRRYLTKNDITWNNVGVTMAFSTIWQHIGVIKRPSIYPTAPRGFTLNHQYTMLKLF